LTPSMTLKPSGLTASRCEVPRSGRGALELHQDLRPPGQPKASIAPNANTGLAGSALEDPVGDPVYCTGRSLRGIELLGRHLGQAPRNQARHLYTSAA
jgi:hypothetical protein